MLRALALASLRRRLWPAAATPGSSRQAADAAGTAGRPSRRSPSPRAEAEAAHHQGPQGGHGRHGEAGDQVTVQYVGVSYTNGRQFDASWDRGEPFDFTLGNGDVIQGWDQGVAGMKVGGRRELIIPPDLAYGPQGQPPTIGPTRR